MTHDMSTQTLTRCDCGHAPTANASPGTGYATRLGGRTMCYACAHESALAEIATAHFGDRATYYVSSDGRRLTTWPGDDLGPVSLGNRHPWSRERRYLTFTDRLGRIWTGTGAPGMYATIRLTKQATR